jgi:hypothetical protein
MVRGRQTLAADTQSPPEATPWQIFLFVKNHYKEILATASAIIASLSGFGLWVIAYFATQKQVNRLDCLMPPSILVQAKPTEIDLVKALLDLKIAGARRLKTRIEQEHFDPDLAVQVDRLTNDIKSLQSRQQEAEKDLRLATEKRLDCAEERKVNGAKAP